MIQGVQVSSLLHMICFGIKNPFTYVNLKSSNNDCILNVRNLFNITFNV